MSSVSGRVQAQPRVARPRVLGLTPREADRVTRVSRRTAAVVISLICVVGLVLAVFMLVGRDPVTPADSQRFAIGDDVRTSFGVVAVEHAVALSGLTDRDIPAAHGVPGIVNAGTLDIQVSAVISNQTNGVLNYRPEQFHLLDAKGREVVLTRVPVLPNELQPHAAVDLLLDFATTAPARPFTIRFDDKTGADRLISLGDVGCKVQSGNGRPLPVVGGCNITPDLGHSH